MSILTGRIFAGHLRSIIGSMTVEEIVTERQKLATEVLDGSKTEMATIGLTVDALQIQSIDDMGAGDIAAMASPHNAAIQRQAKIAQAQADQLAVQAQQESQRQQAEYGRQTACRPGAVQGGGGQGAGRGGPGGTAGPGQRAAGGHFRAGRTGAEAGRAAPAAAGLRGGQARAGRGRTGPDPRGGRRRADPDSGRGGLLNNRVALDQMLISQLPQIVKEAAAGLAGANVSVLNGADGLGEIAAGLVSQGMTILELVRKGISDPDRPASGNGTSPRRRSQAPATPAEGHSG